MKTNKLPSEIYLSCIEFGLLSPREKFNQTKITTGVSSDIWYVEGEKKKFCIKRALKKLTVKEDWFAPVDRSNFEAEYFKVCRSISPNSFPKVLGHNQAKYILAMEWYDNNKYKLWKTKLLNNYVNKYDAIMVAKILAKVHSFFYKKRNYEKHFLNDKTFHDIRIEPYILFTSRFYPQFKSKFLSVAQSLKKNKTTLIHGDFSPKNILIGKSHPIILDAETACWGDPSFDLAFCFNHFILKSIHKNNKKKFLEIGRFFIESYLEKIDFENVDSFLFRFFSILPLFILARVDGKSPVEYFNFRDKEIARKLGSKLLSSCNYQVDSFFSEWSNHI